jgi:hypothetical protein
MSDSGIPISQNTRHNATSPRASFARKFIR